MKTLSKTDHLDLHVFIMHQTLPRDHWAILQFKNLEVEATQPDTGGPRYIRDANGVCYNWSPKAKKWKETEPVYHEPPRKPRESELYHIPDEEAASRIMRVPVSMLPFMDIEAGRLGPLARQALLR